MAIHRDQISSATNSAKRGRNCNTQGRGLRWLKRQTAAWSRRQWTMLGEDAPTRWTKGWA